jgi:hypothetical protein
LLSGAEAHAANADRRGGGKIKLYLGFMAASAY